MLEAGQLQAALERAASEIVQQVGHVVGEVLRLPHTPESCVRVGVQAGARPIGEVRGQGGREQPRVVHREVQPLRSGRRDDVRGIAEQEQLPVAQGLAGEAAHRGYAPVDHRSFRDAPALTRHP